MSRSKWKGYYVAQNLIYKDLPKKIYSRDSVITPKFLNKKVTVHNGKFFIPIFVTKDKLGFKFGEFAYTRKRVNKLLKNKKVKK